MKKLPIVLLAILMVFSLFSCAEPEAVPPKEYTVSFEGITKDPVKVKEGEKFILPENMPSKEGHKLIVKMGNVVLEAGKEYEITADTVLNCNYEKLKFKLTVDGTEQTVEYGDTYTILKKKDGKIMKSVKVDDKAFAEASFVIKKDTTVVYEWRDPATYTVSFEGTGVENLPASFTVTEGNTYTLPTTLPENENHKLVVKNGTEEITPGTEYEISSNITLTCSWERTHYKVSFTGAAPLPAAFNVEVGKKYKLPEPPVNENHKLIVKNGTEEITPGTEYEIKSDITLTCSWERTHYKVSFTGITRDSENIPVSTKTFKIPYIKGYYIESIKLGDEEKKPGTEITLDKDITLAYKVQKGTDDLNIVEGVVKAKTGGRYYTGSIVIPDMTSDGKLVTGIGTDAFRACDGITSVLIPNSIKSIGESSFGWCKNLTSIIIPESVTSIGAYAFTCSGLTSITIPDSVTSIANNAFNYCEHLDSVTLPNNITSIEEAMFYHCIALKSVVIPSGVTSIANQAFRECFSLNSVTIPNGVEFIGYNAFEGDTKISSIVIPSSVTNISTCVFQGWTAEQTINIEKGTNMTGWNSGWKKECNANVVENYTPPTTL